MQIVLFKRQMFACGDVDLRLSQIDSGDGFGDGMLDLQARVHLQKIKVARLRVHNKFHRASVDVTRCLRRRDSRLTHHRPHLRRKQRRGSLFDNFLMTTLNGTFALKEVNGVAV